MIKKKQNFAEFVIKKNNIRFNSTEKLILGQLTVNNMEGITVLVTQEFINVKNYHAHHTPYE